MNHEYYRVKKYWLKCTLGDKAYEYTVLAVDSDNALSMISRQTDWDSVTLRKLSDVIAWAQYSARDISNDPDLYFSLHYHAKPVNQGK